MAMLPPHTPRPIVWALNIVLILIGSAVAHFARHIDWRYDVGFLAGFFFLYFMIRINYGFWPFNND